MTFGVTDADGARAELEASGVKLDGETQVIPAVVKLVSFFDGDGNPLMLAESLSGD